jgi:tripartite-type tricarboxylate transporter receptor subunit TctC
MVPWKLSVPSLVVCALFLAACARPASPSPTAAPSKPEAPAASAPAAKPAAASAPAAAPADQPAFDERAVASFYRGKTIRFVVGFAAGGSYDLATRLVAKQFSKYMPGNPTVIVENRPGASGLIVANEIYRGVYDRDGTVIGTFNGQLILQQAVGKEGIEFDARRFQWIGSMMDSPNVCAARTDVGIDSFADLVAGKELVIGSVAVGSTTYDVPAVMKAALGANFRMVPGYGGTANIRTAVESKEVDGMCTQFTDFTSGVAHWFDASPPLAKFLVVAADKAPDHPYLRNVPTLTDVARTEEARLMLAATTAPIAIAVPYAVAPEVPAERVAALRAAFERVIADNELWADAAKANFEAGPSNAQQVEARVRQVLDSPPAIIEQLKPIIR